MVTGVMLIQYISLLTVVTLFQYNVVVCCEAVSLFQYIAVVTAVVLLEIAALGTSAYFKNMVGCCNLCLHFKQ